MRSLFVLTFSFAVVVAAGCSSTASAPGVTSGDASADSARDDASTNDAALADASTSDSNTAADGSACVLMGGIYDKTCATAADCLMVVRGCYCGAQPVIGVAKSAQSAAQACESEAQMKCALGCANAPGHVGEDGQNDEGTGRNLGVLCDANKCHTVLMP